MPFWGDYDNDGRLDVHLDGALGHWRIYHNDGGSNFSTVTSGPWGDYASYSLHGVWGDLDNDGDLDLSGWTRPSAITAVFWNDGSGASPVTTIGFRVPIRARSEGSSSAG